MTELGRAFDRQVLRHVQWISRRTRDGILIGSVGVRTLTHGPDIPPQFGFQALDLSPQFRSLRKQTEHTACLEVKAIAQCRLFLHEVFVSLLGVGQSFSKIVGRLGRRTNMILDLLHQLRKSLFSQC